MRNELDRTTHLLRAIASACAAVAGLSAPALHAGPALPFRDVAAARHPHPREIAAASLLAEAAGAAVGGGGWLRDGPAASLAAGPRRSGEGDTTSDLEIGIELPLLSQRDRRLDLASSLDQLGESMRRAGESVALADLAAAYAGAWLAQQEAELRRQDLSVVEAWLGAVARRVEAGADPPHEAILVAGERERALLELAAARSEVELAWGELTRLAAVAAAPRALDLSTLPGGDGEQASPERQAAAGIAVLEGIEARRDLTVLLARARSAAAASRWALAANAGREGDEEAARLGVAYRFARRGEDAAVESGRNAAEAAAASEAAADIAALRARTVAAQVALRSPVPALDPAALEAAQRALDTRLTEGRERASQVLPLRRQLLEAALAAAGARAARARAAAEILFLEGGRLP